MALLPKKTTPQEWTDVVLPIFEQPAAPQPKQRSKKQDDDALQVKYRRRPRGGKQLLCERCAVEQPEGLREGIGTASYIRTEGTEEQYLCFHHKAEFQHRDELRGGKG